VEDVVAKRTKAIKTRETPAVQESLAASPPVNAVSESVDTVVEPGENGKSTEPAEILAVQESLAASPPADAVSESVDTVVEPGENGKSTEPAEILAVQESLAASPPADAVSAAVERAGEPGENENSLEPIDPLTVAEGLAVAPPPPADMVSQEAEAGAVPAEKQSWMPLIREILETVVLAVVIWVVVNFATARFIVEGSSMEPNFHTGQMLIVSRLAYTLGASPQRGDVIVFQYPGNLTDDYIKRIIGLPGDTVVVGGGRVTVNGVQLTEPYISSSDLGFEGRPGRWEVPAGSYFVMGDNRGHSSDSRTWGLLPIKDIIGKAWVSYWPPQDWGIIKHYRLKYVPSGTAVTP
jgi:signal peptidase I